MVTVLLGPQESHPSVFELATLLEAANEVNSRLRSQAGAQQDIPSALVRLIQKEFNESFRQVFNSHLPVRWPPPGALATPDTSHQNPDDRTLPPRHGNNAQQISPQYANRSSVIQGNRPTKLSTGTSRRRRTYRHITGGGTKPKTPPPPLSRTGV